MRWSARVRTSCVPDVLDGDGGAGQHRAARVGDAADDVGRGDLGEGRGRQRQAERDEADAPTNRNIRFSFLRPVNNAPQTYLFSNRLHKACNRLQMLGTTWRPVKCFLDSPSGGAARARPGTRSGIMNTAPPRRRPPHDVSNIYEVAKRAGVSTATVSRVLSQPNVVAPGHPPHASCRPSSASGYEPNSAAKNLRTLRTGKLLVTVPDISNPFFSLILQGIEDAAQREGYAVLLGDTQHDDKREERYALMLKRKEADGLIFLGHRLPKEAAAHRCGRWRRGARRSSTAASSARRSASRACTSTTPRPPPRRWIISTGLGHRRIGIVTGPLVSPLSRDRLRGATARAKKQKAERDFIVMHGDFSIESGAAAAERLLGRARTADGDLLLQRRDGDGRDRNRRAAAGCACRRQLSVVGFDDIRFARHIDSAADDDRAADARRSARAPCGCCWRFWPAAATPRHPSR